MSHSKGRLPSFFFEGHDQLADTYEILTLDFSSVADDVLQFLDDDVYQNVTKIILPPEIEPQSWPFDVLGIFGGVATMLFFSTLVKNYRKRSYYQKIPVSLEV